MSLAELTGRLWFYVFADAVLIMLGAGVWFLTRNVVHRRLVELPATLRLKPWHQAWDGLWVGLAALGLAILPVWIGHGYAGPGWTAFKYGDQLAPGAGGLLWGFFGVQSLFEELLFRALAMALLAVLLFWLTGFLFAPATPQARHRFTGWLWFGCGFTANLITSVSFGLVHGNNQNISTLALLNIALAGLVLGQIFWNQGTPLGAWLLHWVWNAGLATLGLPVSGYAIVPPLFGAGFTGARAGAFSGGAFGPEGSIVCTIALTLIWIWLLWLAVTAVQRRRFVAPEDEPQPELQEPGAFPDKTIEP